MREEQVTKFIIKWLLGNSWEIVCFDFPQSGTGHFLHPNGSNDKNKDTINPDIVAVKGKSCLFFENKDRYYYPDFEKQNQLRIDNHYTDDINRLLSKYTIEKIFYGIGLPTEKYGKCTDEVLSLVDFVIGVNDDAGVTVLHKDDSCIIVI